MKHFCFLVLLFPLLAKAQYPHDMPLEFPHPGLETKAPGPEEMRKAGVKAAVYYGRLNGRDLRPMSKYRFPGGDSLYTRSYLHGIQSTVGVYYEGDGDSCVFKDEGTYSTVTCYRKQGQDWLVVEESRYSWFRTSETSLLGPDGKKRLLSEEEVEINKQGKITFSSRVIYQENGVYPALVIDSAYSGKHQRMLLLKRYEFYPGYLNVCKSCSRWNEEGKQIYFRQDRIPESEHEQVEILYGFHYVPLMEKGDQLPTGYDKRIQVGAESKGYESKLHFPSYLESGKKLMDDDAWILTDSCHTEMKNGKPYLTTRWQTTRKTERRYFYNSRGERTGVMEDGSWVWLRLNGKDGEWLHWTLIRSDRKTDTRGKVYPQKHVWKGAVISRGYEEQGIDSLVQKLAVHASPDEKGIGQLQQRVDLSPWLNFIEKKYQLKSTDSVYTWTHKWGTDYWHTRVSNDTFERVYSWNGHSNLKNDTSYQYRALINGEMRTRESRINPMSGLNRWEWERYTYTPDGQVQTMELWVKPYMEKAYRFEFRTEAAYQKTGNSWLFQEERVFRPFPGKNNQILLAESYRANYDTRGNWKGGWHGVFNGSEKDTLEYKHLEITDTTVAGLRTVTQVRTTWSSTYHRVVTQKQFKLKLDAQGHPVQLDFSDDSIQKFWEWDAATGLVKQLSETGESGLEVKWKLEYEK